MDPRTREGLDQAFGWCKACGDTFNWKTPFAVPISSNVGKMVLCTDCGYNMDVVQSLGYLESMFNDQERTERIYLKEVGDRAPLDQIINNRSQWIKFARFALVRWKRGRLDKETPWEYWVRIGNPDISPLDWIPSGGTV